MSPPRSLHTWMLQRDDGVMLQVACTKEPCNNPRRNKVDTLLVYFHGNGDTLLSSERKMHVLKRVEIDAVASFDYRGYGASTGSPSEATFENDAVAVLDDLRARFSPKRIFLYGFSLGGYLAVRVAAVHCEKRFGVKAVFLEAPFFGTHSVAIPGARWLPERFSCRGAITVPRRQGLLCASWLLLMASSTTRASKQPCGRSRAISTQSRPGIVAWASPKSGARSSPTGANEMWQLKLTKQDPTPQICPCINSFTATASRGSRGRHHGTLFHAQHVYSACHR